MTDRESWYERVFEHSLDGIVISRPDGTILRANPAACRILGRSEAEIIRGGRQALIADEAAVAAALERRRATGTATGEGLVTLPDGATVPVEFSTGLLPSTPGDGEIGYAIFRDISERRRADEQLRSAARDREAAEGALRVNEERLEEAQRNAHIGSWLCRPGKPFVWSDETYDLYELARDVPPTFEAVRALVHPEDRDGVLGCAFERALRSTATDVRFEFRVVRPNGQVRWLQAIGKINRAADGSAIDAAGTVQDITDLKAAVLEAERAAVRLAVLADASRAFAEAGTAVRAVLDELAVRVDDAVADSCTVRLITDDGRWLTLVASHSRSPEMTNVLRDINAAHPLRVGVETPIDRVMTSGQGLLVPTVDHDQMVAGAPPDYREALRRFPLHSLLIAPLRAQGRCLGAITVSRFQQDRPSFTSADLALVQELADRAALAVANAHLLEQVQRELTERKRAVAESSRLAAVIEQASEMVMITDKLGTIQYVNPAFEAVTGYPRAEVLGKNPRILRSGAQSPEIYRGMWAVISAGKTWRGRLVNRKKDGSYYTEDANIAPVRDAAGMIAGYFALKRDITRDLSLEAQLFQAQKMEGIGRLAGGVAHDFNNLLSVILGCARFALEDLKPGDPLREDLVEIERAGERAAVLTRQLLAFSRRQALKAEPLDLNRVIGDMHKMLQRILGEDVELVEAFAPRLGIVKADAGQMEQVIMNLAVNARDAMPKGGRLTIATEDVDIDAEFAAARGDLLPGPHVRVSVTDTGIGMDVKTQARIFEPFFTTKEQGKGTGLGLSTVYGIVTQSGGRVHVYSELGHGTTVSVYLPRVDAPAAAPRPALPSTKPRGVETVLLVEDDEAVRKIARRVLENAGFKVLAASNGGEGLLLCEQHEGTIHLVVSDVVMPMMSGPDFVARARKLRPQLKALFMSGYTDDAIVRHGLLDGDVDFVNKPLSQGELLKRVREAIDRPLARAPQ